MKVLKKTLSYFLLGFFSLSLTMTLQPKNILAQSCEPSDDALAPLSDEFDDSATLNDPWNLEEANALAFDIDQSNSGNLTIQPPGSYNYWYARSMGPFLYKNIAGNFVAEMDLNVHQEGDESTGPLPYFKSGGLVARVPGGSVGSVNNNWLFYALGNQTNSFPNNHMLSTEFKNTVNSQSKLTARDSGGSHQGKLRLCRIDDKFYAYRWLDNENGWSEEQAGGFVNSPVTRSDFPDIIEVGAFASSYESNPNVVAEFDYIRFGTPTSAADCLMELPAYCDGGGSPGDADGDGVPDEFDQYPNDPERAFEVRYPPEGNYFIAFEDNFPKVGDGDYNDLIAAMNFTEVTNADNKIVDIIGEVFLVARGACFDHDFHLLINFPGANADLTTELYNPSGSLVESVNHPTQVNLADMKLFQNTAQQIRDDSNSFCNIANTDPDFDLVQGYKASFQLTFPTPIAKSTVDAPPYDPYLYILRRGGEYGYDVHLPNKQPIAGSRNPVETVGNNFIDANGYPWALLVPENWFHPTEKTLIENAYEQFVQFRDSRGTENLLWYQEAQPGLILPYPADFFSF